MSLNKSKDNWASLGPPYDYDIPPYTVSTVDKKGVVREQPIPSNTVDEALKKAKSLKEQGVVVFVEGVAPSHEDESWLVRHPHSDPFGKMKKYQKYRDSHPLPPKR